MSFILNAMQRAVILKTPSHILLLLKKENFTLSEILSVCIMMSLLFAEVVDQAECWPILIVIVTCISIWILRCLLDLLIPMCDY